MATMNRLQRSTAARAVAPVAALLLFTAVPVSAVADVPPRPADLTGAAAARFAELALACVHREYPTKIAHSLESDADVLPPRELTPAFYGCYDWHSAVHAHWLLVRAARLFPAEPFAAAARAAVAESLTPANIEGEVAYLSAPGRGSFERPYGLAWLLMLAAELRASGDSDSMRLAATLAPLEALAAEHIRVWLPKLRYPTRSGEHSQTAFALTLVWEWARETADTDMQRRLSAKALQFYLHDRDCPLTYEPSGEDFLSPCLGEADLMRRVLPAAMFARWLHVFLPGVPHRASSAHDWLRPGIVSDRSDPRLAHLDGLNLSRAWMLEGIAEALPPGDARIASLRAAAAEHRELALPAVTGEHYTGGHWLGSFALFLISGADAAHLR
jgi:hypothetical protein